MPVLAVNSLSDMILSMDKRKLTKAEITDVIKERTGYPSSEIAVVIDELFSVISEGLSEGRTAELRGFGTFEVKRRTGRAKARNPKTGEIVSVAPHGVAAFRAGKELKQAVWDICQE